MRKRSQKNDVHCSIISHFEWKKTWRWGGVDIYNSAACVAHWRRTHPYCMFAALKTRRAFRSPRNKSTCHFDLAARQKKNNNGPRAQGRRRHRAHFNRQVITGRPERPNVCEGWNNKSHDGNPVTALILKPSGRKMEKTKTKTKLEDIKTWNWVRKLNIYHWIVLCSVV